jgi:hypothetical protein
MGCPLIATGGKMKDFSDTQPTSLYEAAIGTRNQPYYLDKFETFDENGPGLHPSWNWAAFFFTGFWALYRKLYGWFLGWICIFSFLGVMNIVTSKSPSGALWVAVGNLAVVAGFAAYANSLYHAKTKARIAAAKKSCTDAARVNRRLSAGSGVHMWLPIGLGTLFSLGILVALVLPAYQESTNRPKKDSEVSQEAGPQVAYSKGTLDDPASKPANEAPIHEATQVNQAPPAPEPNIGKVEEANFQLHLVCTNDALGGLKGNTSFWREGGHLIYQHMSVVLRDGQIDKYGGTTRISETPAQFRVEYENPGASFKSLTTLDRITGRLSETSERPNKNPTTQIWDCVVAKPKM